MLKLSGEVRARSGHTWDRRHADVYNSQWAGTTDGANGGRVQSRAMGSASSWDLGGESPPRGTKVALSGRIYRDSVHLRGYLPEA